MTRLMRDKGFFFHIWRRYAQDIPVRRLALRIAFLSPALG
jgi:hypothetical protein